MGRQNLQSKVIPLPTGGERDTGDASGEMSLIRGGPIYKFQASTHLIVPGQWNLRRRILTAVLITWVPLVVLAIASAGETWRISLGSLLRDYRVNARLFVAVPLLIIGQTVIDTRFREVLAHFLKGHLIKTDALPEVQEILATAKKLRDSWLPELVVVIAVYAQIEGLAVKSAYLGETWAVSRAAGGISFTAAGWYFSLVSLPISLVLLGIALWKWAIWVFVLYRFSRLPLQLVPSDPDLTGGLGFLAWIPAAFASVVFASAVVISATWRYQILHGMITLQSCTVPAILLAILVLLIFFAPLALFTPLLMQLRRRGLHEYDTLGHIHASQFHQKWIEQGEQHQDELLTAPEISTLTDLSTSVANVRKMRPFPFAKQPVAQVLVAALLPMIPVVTTQIPLRTLLKEIFSALH